MLVNACKDRYPSTLEVYNFLWILIGNKGRDYGCFHTICWLLYWRELSLRLIILHARFKGELVIKIIPIVTWVPGPDLLASIEKGKGLCSADTIVYLQLQYIWALSPFCHEWQSFPPSSAGTPHRATAQHHSVPSRRSGRACTSSHRWLHEDLLTHGGSREVAGWMTQGAQRQ